MSYSCFKVKHTYTDGSSGAVVNDLTQLIVARDMTEVVKRFGDATEIINLGSAVILDNHPEFCKCDDCPMVNVDPDMHVDDCRCDECDKRTGEQFVALAARAHDVQEVALCVKDEVEGMGGLPKLRMLLELCGKL